MKKSWAGCEGFSASPFSTEYSCTSSGALQIVQHDVQAIARVVVDAVPVGVDDGGRHRVVFVGIDGVVAFRQHHVERSSFEEV